MPPAAGYFKQNVMWAPAFISEQRAKREQQNVKFKRERAVSKWVSRAAAGQWEALPRGLGGHADSGQFRVGLSCLHLPVSPQTVGKRGLRHLASVAQQLRRVKWWSAGDLWLSSLAPSASLPG